MNRQLRILLAGVLVVIPFAVTVAIIWWATSNLGQLGYQIMTSHMSLAEKAAVETNEGLKIKLAVVGALAVIVCIYFIGLLTKLYLFRRLVHLAEVLFSHVPGVKTIYESVRDLLKLFGGGSGRMGKVVLYHPNGGEMAMLGILTNAKPTGLANVPGHDLVAVYLPLAYMLGGPVIYAPRKHIQELDLPVEEALKLAATAEITAAPKATIED